MQQGSKELFLIFDAQHLFFALQKVLGFWNIFVGEELVLACCTSSILRCVLFFFVTLWQHSLQLLGNRKVDCDASSMPLCFCVCSCFVFFVKQGCFLCCFWFSMMLLSFFVVIVVVAATTMALQAKIFHKSPLHTHIKGSSCVSCTSIVGINNGIGCHFLLQ